MVCMDDEKATFHVRGSAVMPDWGREEACPRVVGWTAARCQEHFDWEETCTTLYGVDIFTTVRRG
jgi:hypothetical protein